jgi:hypothetical protein
MNENLNERSVAITPINQPSRAKLRVEADQMLSDIAFVLKMTQRVRAEMNVDEEADELVLA